jgi:hypothetical protein
MERVFSANATSESERRESIKERREASAPDRADIRTSSVSGPPAPPKGEVLRLKIDKDRLRKRGVST